VEKLRGNRVWLSACRLACLAPRESILSRSHLSRTRRRVIFPVLPLPAHCRLLLLFAFVGRSQDQRYGEIFAMAIS
jgi:hypothetical protein